MRVFEVQKFGLDFLTMTERPTPKPGPGQALVRMRAASLNYRDLLMVQGAYNPRQPLPLIPLSDGAGEVIETGEGVTRVKRGDRVAGIFAQRWLGGEPDLAARSSTLGGPLDGMLAEYAALHEDGLVKVPDHLTYEEASTLPCAGVTAWNALIAQGCTKAGDTVLVQGTGGVSIFALQLALSSGARVIVTSGDNAKLEKALKLGASEGINYKENPDWDKRVLELTGMSGVDHIIEVGGAGTLAKSLNAVRIGGIISVIGILGGTATQVDLLRILMKCVRMQGIFVGHRQCFEAMNRAIAFHKIKPVIGRTFKFDESRDAFAYLQSARHFGKIVIQF